MARPADPDVVPESAGSLCEAAGLPDATALPIVVGAAAGAAMADAGRAIRRLLTPGP
jgi:hypothetical protein